MQIIGNLVELLKQVLYLSSIFGCNNVMCLFFSGHLVSYPRNNDILSIRVLSIVSRRGRRVETALPQGTCKGHPYYTRTRIVGVLLAGSLGYGYWKMSGVLVMERLLA